LEQLILSENILSKTTNRSFDAWGRVMEEGSPMVEGSRGMVMVISMKTMLWFSREDDNSYSAQDKTILGEELGFHVVCCWFLYRTLLYCNLLLLQLNVFFLSLSSGVV